MCKIEKSGRGRPGSGFGHSDTPGLNVVLSLGEYINAVVSRIVIGTLDLKQFLPKFKYFC